MAKNTGKTSEKIWEDHHRRLGKRAFFFRFVDSSEIRGRTGRVATSARAQPSDYILTLDGVTEFAEVKSTTNPTSFSQTLLRSSQIAAARQIEEAGGRYVIYVHQLATNHWYRLPFSEFTGTMKWEQMARWEWFQ